MPSRIGVALKCPGRCEQCRRDLEPATAAWWDPATHAVTCRGCDLDQPADQFVDVAPSLRGVPGGSAQAEYERRTRNPGHNRVAARPWKKGADGERRLSALLHQAENAKIIVLDDRGMPTGRGNIDHLVVAPSGIYVIDAKNHTGTVKRKVEGYGRQRTEHLIVNGRKRTKLLAAMGQQVEAVRTALDRLDGSSSMAIIPVLCFINIENWGGFHPAFTVTGVHVMWTRPLLESLRSDGPLDGNQRARIARLLSTQLTPAIASSAQ